MSIHCFASKAQKQPLEPFEYNPESLGPWDVEVKISHCGICHSDIHLIDNDWGISRYPLVPGHEIIGTVTALGPKVKDLKMGDRVGIGWQRSSCLSCEWCKSGEENLCAKQEATCVGHAGGFAESIRSDSRFAFRIPESLESQNAAPLLCGGATVYSPLKRHGVDKTKKVGIIGIGGLGHLALQFAKALGAHVTAFSSTPSKEAEAKQFGADQFVSSIDARSMPALAGSLDFILCTISEPLDWTQYMDILRTKGVLCFVGVQSKPINLPVMAFIHGRRSVDGSNIGSRREIEEMLQFAAKHGIQAQTELFPLNEANAAIAKVRANKVRYRAVLKV